MDQFLKKKFLKVQVNFWPAKISEEKENNIAPYFIVLTAL